MRWSLKSPASRLFAQPFVQGQKTLKLCVSGLCEGNLRRTGGFASKRTSNAVSIWWRHHVLFVWRYLLWEQYFHLCYTVFTIAFYKTMLQRDLTVLYGINKNNFHISDTRFRHFFLNYYQKRDSVMAMTWRVLDEVTVVPWTKTRSRIECACSCANWSNCTRIWFISVEKTCYHVPLEVIWPWMTRDWYCSLIDVCI